MKTITTLLFFFLLQGLTAQGVLPGDWGLKAFLMDDPDLGRINYYVTEKGIDHDKPLVFMVSGTRGLPVMLVVKEGDRSIRLGTIPPDQIKAFSDQYHVAFLGKPGTPFCDTFEVDRINPMQNLEDYPPSDEYIEKCGLDWEIAASIRVLDRLADQLPNYTGRVIAIGLSEGGQLVPRLAAEYDGITHLVCVATSTLNQFFSTIINLRMDAAAGHITHREAQREIDSLFDVCRDIYADPESTEKWYYGHPYKRWGSYCSDIPLEHLVRLDIPILHVKGTADRNSPVLHSDYVMLEFLRLGKTNLTYRTFPGVDHWLSETVEKEGNEDHISRREDVFRAISEWISEN
jgi:hypothetical protein